MNWDQVEGNWRNVKGQIQQKWGKLTDDDIEQTEGRRERLVGKIQARYGEAREKIERQIDGLIDKL